MSKCQGPEPLKTSESFRPKGVGREWRDMVSVLSWLSDPILC
jgi:hypothetical protein